jgi:PIN domain nuclease of toxin-antitoxin system
MPRLLLDTHVVLWWLADDSTLSDDIKDMIDEEVDVFVSTATIWEIAIKQAKGKLISPADLPQQVRDCDLDTLPIAADHAIRAGRLPLLHADPFDRMIVAQAQCEGLTVVSRDEAVSRYDVAVLRC